MTPNNKHQNNIFSLIEPETIERLHLTSRRPCWCTKTILWELNSFLTQSISIDAGHVSENPLYIHGSHPVGPRLLSYWSHGSHACGTKQDDLKNDLQHWPSASAKTKLKI